MIPSRERVAVRPKANPGSTRPKQPERSPSGYSLKSNNHGRLITSQTTNNKYGVDDGIRVKPAGGVSRNSNKKCTGGDDGIRVSSVVTQKSNPKLPKQQQPVSSYAFKGNNGKLAPTSKNKPQADTMAAVTKKPVLHSSTKPIRGLTGNPYWVQGKDGNLAPTSTKPNQSTTSVMGKDGRIYTY